MEEFNLFSYLTKNWRARPLISYEVIVNLIAGTHTQNGLEVKCELDSKLYARGRKVTARELSAINLSREAFRGDWNYSIRPAFSMNV